MTNMTEIVKEKYGQAALRAAGGTANGCCGAARAGLNSCDPITGNLYDASQTVAVPEAAMLASLGCGNPTALAQLNPGEIVLDLGSGGGIDVILSAKRVGPAGKAYGLDMTDEMLALAEANKRTAGIANVEFLKGEIENIPLPDDSVDVIISNCVINLSGNKDRVLREAFRVLKPGGRFAVSDVVTRGEMLPEIRQNVLLWVGCVAGALEENDFREKLTAAGFRDVDIEPTRIYRMEDAREFLSGQGLDVDAIASQVDGKFMAAFVRATKPALQAPTMAPVADQTAVRDRKTFMRRLVSEALGTALLLATVVGSGIMGERLALGGASGSPALALLVNTLATGAMLVALILTFGPISGAHLNPAVTLADAWQGGISWREVPGYVMVQSAGAIAGVAIAHLMFSEPVFRLSRHPRAGNAQMFSEFIATFGLLTVIWGCSQHRSEMVPFAVGAYITAAYWFTASTSFANPAVTLARALTDTFAGIRPSDVTGFVCAQLAGAAAATALCAWLVPALQVKATHA